MNLVVTYSSAYYVNATFSKAAPDCICAASNLVSQYIIAGVDSFGRGRRPPAALFVCLDALLL